MPIHTLTAELVQEIIASYGQIRTLNLSTNEISHIENLERLTGLTKLNLFGNRLGPAPESLAGLARLTCLKELDLSHNNITSFHSLSAAPTSLQSLNAANNAIAQVTQVTVLTSLTALTELVLSGNPVASEVGYRRQVLETLSSLQALDHTPRLHHVVSPDNRQPQTPPSQVWADLGVLGTGPVEPLAPAGNKPLCKGDDQDLPSRSWALANPFAGSPGSSPKASVAICTGHRDTTSEHVDAVARLPDNPPTLSVSRTDAARRSEASAMMTVLSTARSDVDRHHSHRRPRSEFERVSDSGTLGVESKQWLEQTMLNAPTPVPLASATERVERPPAAWREEHGTALFSGDAHMHGGDGRVVEEVTRMAALGPRQPWARRDEARVTVAPNESPAVPSAVARADWHGAEGSVRTRGGARPLQAGSRGNDKGHGLDETARRWPGKREATPEPSAQGLPEPASPSRLEASSSSEGPFESDHSAPPRRAEVPPREAERDREGNVGRFEDDDHGYGNAIADARHQDVRNSRDRIVNHVTDYNHRTTMIREGYPAIQRDSGMLGVGSAEANTIRGRFHVGTERRGVNVIKNAGFDGGADHGRMSSLFDAKIRQQETPRPNVSGRSAGGVCCSLPSGWGTLAAPLPSSTPMGTSKKSSAGVSTQAPRATVGRSLDYGCGGGLDVLMVGRAEWEALKQENDTLRRQLNLSEKRCIAQAEMQHLADKELAREHISRLTPPPTAIAAAGARNETFNAGNIATNIGNEGRSVQPQSGVPSQDRSEESSREQSPEPFLALADDSESDEDSDRVTALLALWRSEVLKLLLQRGQVAETAAEDSRKAECTLSEEREARARAEADAKGLTQRALAAEAEAELAGIKLEQALEDVRETRNKRRAAESSLLGHSSAARELHVWVRGFVGRASEGFYEREALLARGVAKLEAFAQRVGLAAGRLEVLRTLLQRKEVQLRNSRAALAADRRVWLLERRQTELAALTKTQIVSSSDTEPSTLPPQSGGQRAEFAQEGPRGRRLSGAVSEWCPPLLEGLRPECEAVMRALFCRVDRLGMGAVRARRLLSVLRSDCGVSQLMEASVGGRRWHAALDTMEARLCPSPNSGSDVSGQVECGAEDPTSQNCAKHDPSVGAEVESAEKDERDVTWGEFLLFFLPSAGPSDEAYNAGLIAPASSGHRQGLFRIAAGTTRTTTRATSSQRPLDFRTVRDFGNVSEDAAALLQMVVPQHWAAGGGPAAPVAFGATGGGEQEGALAALSVGRLRQEVRRLGRERGYLLGLLKEDGRLGARRVEAVHDQYRHEMRALHARVKEVELSLQESVRRADEGRDMADSLQEELSGLREEMRQAELDWRRQLDKASEDKASALETCSREASQAASTARERFSRLEAEHALALRENGKASVRHRALERELARIKNSLETEARLEKEALEERLRAGSAKLTVARRERNALLAALRDIQRKERIGPHTPSPPSLTQTSLETPLNQPAAAATTTTATTTGVAVRPGEIPEGVTSAASEGDAQGLKVSVKRRGSDGRDGGIENQRHTSGNDKARSDWVVVGTGSERSANDTAGKGKSAGRADEVAGDAFVGDKGGSKNASLAARLEMLALQTQQLLEEDSEDDDSSSSSHDSKPER